jgi:hypothetical protein
MPSEEADRYLRARQAAAQAAAASGGAGYYGSRFAPPPPVRPNSVGGSTHTRTVPPGTTPPPDNTNRNGGGGGGGVKKTDDLPQLRALQKMIDSSFAGARDIKLGNIQTILGQQNSELLRGYDERAGQLKGSKLDNEKSEADSSFANLINRARERADTLAETAAQGAGESDTLKSQMMAIRNWDANQHDVNRSYFDTVRSINNAATDLNADTRSSRMNLYSQSLSDQEQTWANFYNQQADAYTQMGNLQANPYSNAYKANSDSFNKAAETAGMSWVNPGIPTEVQNWEGSFQAEEGRLNNTQAQAAVTNLAQKKPEGATLRKW